MGKCIRIPSRSEFFRDCHNPLLAWNPHLKFLVKEGAKVSGGSNAILLYLLGEPCPLGLERALGNRALVGGGGKKAVSLPDA